MFEHSIKVPRLYKDAAKILRDVKEKGSSLKQLTYQCKHRNLKAVYALVAETIKHFTSIETIIEQSQLLEKENRLEPWLARILIMEMLWRGKQLPLQAKPLQTINSYYDILKQHKDAIESNTQATDVIKKVQKPRFARINTLKITLQEAIDAFREEGWALTRYSSESYDDYIAKSSSLGSEEFIIDIHIKELLLFSSNTKFYNHKAYKDGYILLQDKASCLSAHLLNPTPGSTVLDMCAAPGMKTTHVAALLDNKGVVYAVEMNQQRFNTLNKMVQNADATCVKTIHKDAVTLTAEDCPNVEYILVDPSCSGSGMLDRITIDNKEEEISPARLRKLADFQAVLLHHALSKFPQVKRVVYSTCSVYPEENEHVVSRVLDKHSNFKLISARELLNGLWTNSPSEDVASITDKCIYANPEKDLTNGFFIAVIERINSEDLDSNDKIESKNKQTVRKNSESNMVTNENSYENKNKNKKDKDIKQEIKEEKVEMTTNNEQDVSSISKKKKKKKKHLEETERRCIQNYIERTEENVSKKKHKKKKISDQVEVVEETISNTKKNKKKEQSITTEDAINDNEVLPKANKKKKKHSENITEEAIANNESEDVVSKQNKKKRKHCEKDIEVLDDNKTDDKAKHKKVKTLGEENNSKIKMNELELASELKHVENKLENRQVDVEPKKSKKKKKNSEAINETVECSDAPGTKKHKKKKIKSEENSDETLMNKKENVEVKQNKKKKKERCQ
ncbi:hypothetical protein ILUMI_00410 [Ignelater luminosus]|uniref:SAM-dependent MTase RsmB/NOP-type domain-containing protein n=1 Tax=Ignelater luminosus TaxID=2038154 RepID=A0A8K0DLY4_IGNLU|nr:hypothetical protein ILUMI_00410 [Ignelater luminosus]